MDREQTVSFKSKRFAIRIVRLYQHLRDNKKEYVLSKQLLRSGTSIGANLAESECAVSRKDFLSKVYIAFKEANETLYWLDLLHETDYLSNLEYASIRTDCEELRKLLSAITKTLTDSLNSSLLTPNSSLLTPNGFRLFVTIRLQCAAGT